MVIGDRFSRQKSILATSVAVAALGALYPMLCDPTEIMTGGFALVTAIHTLVTLGVYGKVPELFPTQYRLRGAGLAGMCGRAASIATPYATIWAFEQFGVQGVLLAVIAVLAALRAAILTLGVETAKLSLDDNGALADGAEEALAARR